MLNYSTPPRILKIEKIHSHRRLIKITTDVSLKKSFPSSLLENYQSIASSSRTRHNQDFIVEFSVQSELVK